MTIPEDFIDDLLLSDLEEIHRKKEKIRNTLKETQGMLKVYEKARKKKLWIGSIAGLSATACITVFLIFLLPSLQKITGYELYQSYYQKYSVNLDIRAPGSESALRQAMEFYEKGQSTFALKKLESIFIEDSSNPGYIFYMALFNLDAGYYEFALSGFQSLIREGGSYGLHASWYTALIYVREGNYPSARDHLKVLRKAPDSIYRKKTSRLLRKIRFR